MSLQRPLSGMERAFWLLDRGTRFNGVGIVSLRGELDEALVRAGLGRVQARHPFLRMRVSGDDRHLQFTEQGAGPLPLQVVRQEGPDHWQRIVEKELNLGFAADADHLTRVNLLVSPGRSELLITHHHVIADALSMVMVVRDLLTAIAALMDAPAGQGAPVQSLPLVESLPLQPPLTELLPDEARGLARFGHMQAFFQKHVVARPQRRARKLPIEQPAPPEERRNCIVHRQLQPAETQALSQRARAEGTSIQGALGAALLLATAEVAYAEELAAATPTTVGCFTTVNLREKLKPPQPEGMGIYMSQATTFHQIVPPPPLWQLAVELKTQLTESLQTGEQYLTMPLIGMFIPWGKDPGPRFIRRFDGGSPAALGVSNLARPPISGRYGALTIENFHMAVGVSVVGQLVGAVTTWDDQLNLNLVFIEPLLSRARAERIADAAMVALRAALAATKAAT